MQSHVRSAQPQDELSTPRFVETRDWYRDLFGLDVLEEWDEPADRGCILGWAGEAGDALLEIYHCDRPLSFAGLSLQFRVTRRACLKSSASFGRFPRGRSTVRAS